MDISQLFISFFILLVLFIVVGTLCTICCRHQNIMRSSNEVGYGVWSEYPAPNIVPSATPQPPPGKNEIFHYSPSKNTDVQRDYLKNQEDIATCENGGGYLIPGDSNGCDTSNFGVSAEVDNGGGMCDSGGGGNDATDTCTETE